jgi:alpha-glucosidase
MSTITGLLVMMAAAVGATSAQQYEVRSPDTRTRVVVQTGAQLTWSVEYAESVVLAPSPISMTLASGQVLGHGGRVSRRTPRTVDDVIRPVVAEKNAVVPDRFNDLRLDFNGGWALVVRAYDDGVAYRFVTSLPDSVTVQAEEASFRFAGNYTAVFGADSLWLSHQEPLYRRIPLDSLTEGLKGLLPLVLEVETGLRLVVMESALEDYPGMHVKGAGGGTIAGVFPRFALVENKTDIENVSVAEAAPYIARTAGKREYPWRVLAIAPDDRALLENQIVCRLAPELRIEDPSWIRPGKVAWDWWNDRNFHEVDFRAGINQRTYEEYVNFASEFGIEYVILDLGWSPVEDLMTMVPAMDVPALVKYAGERNVGIILWALWKPLDERMEEVLDLWQEWGVKGIKVDYMQRDDQAVVQFYWRLAHEAAERQMLVDYHGAYKPGGLRRAYPNVLTREGVRGLEFNKWSGDITPEHDVTLPFTRMLAGPMDYTPGAMINAGRQEHRPVFTHPMSQGTRAHQMALYVVFESPLQMLSDNPQHYRQEPDVTRFIAAVPTTWDETRALLGASGDYVAIARRKGDSWWVGALTDWESRSLTLDFSFLKGGRYRMELYRDGINADRHGSDHLREVSTLEGGGRLEVQLARGGGWVARLTPLEAPADSWGETTSEVAR